MATLGYFQRIEREVFPHLRALRMERLAAVMEAAQRATSEMAAIGRAMSALAADPQGEV